MTEDSQALQRRIDEQEKEIKAQTAQLAAVYRELEDLAHFISHDLRAPLRGIDGYSRILIEEYSSNLDELGRAYIQYIHDASMQAARLIDRLLYYWALRASLQPETVDLSALAGEIAANLRSKQPERVVTFMIAPGLSAVADRKMMRTLLENLLGNAWKFTPTHPTAHIQFGVAQLSPGFVKERDIPLPAGEAFFIQDDGAGVNMAYRDKLFVPFQRLHGAHEFEGMGIGLATARRISQRHGGEMWLEGEIEKGTTVYFTLNVSMPES